MGVGLGMLKLPLYHLPSVVWFARLAWAQQVGQAVWLAWPPRLPRLSLFNRAYLAGPGGQVQRVSVPVVRARRGPPLAQAQLDLAQPWPLHYARTLQTLYGSAPYWLHYGPAWQAAVQAVEVLLHHLPDQDPAPRLLAYNAALVALACQQLGLPTPALWPSPAGGLVPANRQADHRHYAPPAILQLPYAQGTAHFVPGLAVLDLLMHLGPAAPAHLLACCR